MTVVTARFYSDTFLDDWQDESAFNTLTTMRIGAQGIMGQPFDRTLHGILNANLNPLGIPADAIINSAILRGYCQIPDDGFSDQGQMGVYKCIQDSNENPTWKWAQGDPIFLDWSVPGAPHVELPGYDPLNNWPTAAGPWATKDLSPIVVDAIANEGGILRLVQKPVGLVLTRYPTTQWWTEEWNVEGQRWELDIDYDVPATPITAIERGSRRGRDRGRARGL